MHKNLVMIFSLHSNTPTYFSKVFPHYCTTFRETDIFCTINEEKKLFIFETNKIIEDNENNPNIFLLENELNIDDSKNLKPISLNYDNISSYGDIYDSFLLEYHNKEKIKLLYYILYIGKTFILF